MEKIHISREGLGLLQKARTIDNQTTILCTDANKNILLKLSLFSTQLRKSYIKLILK